MISNPLSRIREGVPGPQVHIKKGFYIFAFTILGVLLQFVVHGVLETWYIGLLLANFRTYSLGMSWSAWVTIHNVLTVALFAAGVAFGFQQGRYWWRRVYIERKWKLPHNFS